MAHDPVLSEIRRIREKYSLQFDGDVSAMMDDLRRRHAQSEQEILRTLPKPSPTYTPTPVEDRG